MTSVGNPHHATLVANTVATFTFASNGGQIVVLNRDGAAEVYFRSDGVDPVVGADGCDVLPAAIGAVATLDGTKGQPSEVRLISTGTPKVTVKVL